jgi:hypothetical protein
VCPCRWNRLETLLAEGSKDSDYRAGDALQPVLGLLLGPGGEQLRRLVEQEAVRVTEVGPTRSPGPFSKLGLLFNQEAEIRNALFKGCQHIQERLCSSRWSRLPSPLHRLCDPLCVGFASNLVRGGFLALYRVR